MIYLFIIGAYFTLYGFEVMPPIFSVQWWLIVIGFALIAQSITMMCNYIIKTINIVRGVDNAHR
jgi:hypothetical protein